MLKSFKQTLKFIRTHPFAKNHSFKAIRKWISWQIRSRLWQKPVLLDFIEGSKFVVKGGMTGATGNIYTGLHEFHDMAFLLHLLKEQDLFEDVGANIGSYTILASKVRGARTIAFEPVPSTFYWLMLNKTANQIEHLVDARNMGCSNKKEVVLFSKDSDTTNHVLTEEETLNSLEVPMIPLDQAINETIPLLLKIDVEGFETKVLAGSTNLLKSESLKAIIIELNGSGTRYGFDENAIHQNLLSLGFNPYHYNAFQRTLTKVSNFGSGNTIYVRDVKMVSNRLTTSKPFMIWGYKI